MRILTCLSLFLLALSASQTDAAPKKLGSETLAEERLKIEETGVDKDRSKKSTTTFCVEIQGNCQDGEPAGQTVSIVQADRPGAVLSISPKSQPDTILPAELNAHASALRNSESTDVASPMPNARIPKVDNVDPLDPRFSAEQRAFRSAYKECLRERVLSAFTFKSASEIMYGVNMCFQMAVQMHPEAREMAARYLFSPMEGENPFPFPYLGPPFIRARDNGADVDANGNSLKVANDGGVVPMYREEGNAPSGQPASDPMSPSAGQPASEVASEPSAEPAAEPVPKPSQPVSEVAVELTPKSDDGSTPQAVEVPVTLPVEKQLDEPAGSKASAAPTLTPCQTSHQAYAEADAEPIAQTARHSAPGESLQQLRQPDAPRRGEPLSEEANGSAARNAAPEPIAEPLPEPAARNAAPVPISESLEGSAAGNAAPEPIPEALPEPAAAPLPEPVPEVIPESAVESVSGNSALPVSEPADAPSTRQAPVEPLAEPSAVATVEPVVEPASAPESSAPAVSDSQPASPPLPETTEAGGRAASDSLKPSDKLPLPYERSEDQKPSARSNSDRYAIGASCTTLETNLGILPVPRPCKKKVLVVQPSPCMLVQQPAYPPLGTVVQVPSHCQCGCSHGPLQNCEHHAAYMRSVKSKIHMRSRSKDFNGEHETVEST